MSLTDDLGEDTAQETTTIPLDGAKIPYGVAETDDIAKVLFALALTPPEGHIVESIKLTFTLAKAV